MIKSGESFNIWTSYVENPSAMMIFSRGLGRLGPNHYLLSSLKAKNIQTVCFDFSPLKEASFTKDLNRLHFVISKLKEEFPNLPILIYASSYGASIAFTHLFRFPQNIAGIIANSPIADPVPVYGKFKNIADWKKEGFANINGQRLSYSFYEDSIRYNLFEEAIKLGIPSYIVVSKNDPVVPCAQGVELAKKVGAEIEVFDSPFNPVDGHSGFLKPEWVCDKLKTYFGVQI